ncbi:hypothetical protein ACFYKX_25205 [Cytobacillus sp. FJAT-54145]|uniref:Uncharacterized protein n=1 Tax=Cytobacillus spartinae TaxID=3299023 RepID=A0ABW6KHY6_9BACI
MDRVERNVKNFFDGNGMYLLGSNLLMGTLASLVPTGSWSVFTLYMLITLFQLGLSWIWWKSDMTLIRFNSLTAFLLCITMGLFFVVPLLRLTIGVLSFWLILAIYVCITFYALVRKELIFQAFHKPGKSKIAKGTVIILFLLIILGGFTYANGQEMVIMANLDDNQGAFFISTFLYVLGLLITFVSTALLKKPQEIKN